MMGAIIEKVDQITRKVQQQWHGVLRAGVGQAEVLNLSGHSRRHSGTRVPFEDMGANTQMSAYMFGQ